MPSTQVVFLHPFFARSNISSSFFEGSSQIQKEFQLYHFGSKISWDYKYDADMVAVVVAAAAVLVSCVKWEIISALPQRPSLLGNDKNVDLNSRFWKLVGGLK